MIQIDMPMPTNCLDCPACNEYLACAIPVNGRKWGENDVREFGRGRPEWCPLKEQEAFNKKEIREQLEDIKNLVENDVHPAVSPDNWYIYANLHDEIEQLEILLERYDVI